MNKIYVDVENVGLKFVPIKDNNFEYILVYHNGMLNNQVKKFKERYREVIVDRVVVGGEQVADMRIYQLITEDFNKNSDNKYAVLSNDKGFCRYSKVTGINIKRFNLKEYKREIVKYLDEISRGTVISEIILKANSLANENDKLKKELEAERERIKKIKNIVIEEGKQDIKEEKTNILNMIIKKLDEYRKICPVNKKINIDFIEKLLKKYYEHNAKDINPNARKMFITATNTIIVVLKGRNILDYDFLKFIKNNIEKQENRKIVSKEIKDMIVNLNKKNIVKYKENNIFIDEILEEEESRIVAMQELIKYKDIDEKDITIGDLIKEQIKSIQA